MDKDPQKRYQEAARLLQDGRLGEAEAVFRELADEYPSRPEFLLGLYNVSVQKNDPESAVAPLRQVLDLLPGNVQVGRQLSMVLNNLGTRASAGEDFSAARQRLQDAVRVDPHNHLAWFNLGLVYKRLGQMQNAVRPLRQAVDLQPENPEYRVALVQAEKIHQPAAANEGLTALVRALPEEPGMRLAVLELVLELRGREAALDFLHTQVGEGAGLSADTLPLFARLQERLRLFEQSVETTRRCVAQQPESRDLRSTLAWRLNQAGRYREAKAEYAALYAEDCSRCYPLIASQLLLPGVYADRDELQRTRHEYGMGLDRLEETLGEDGASPVSKLGDLAWSNFFLAYQGEDDRALQRRYGRLLERLTAPWQEDLRTDGASRARRRIAVVSSFLRDCTVGHYFFSWLEALVAAGHEVLPVQLGRLEDGFTAQIERLCGALVRVRDGVEKKLSAIRELQADVIVYPELGMDADTFLIASFRLAPVQLCGWGHPSTTGLASIDCYLSCESMEPEGAERHYTESLLLLPGLGTAYRPTTPSRPGRRGDFGLPEGVPLYLFPHAPFKIHPANDRMLAELLALDPDGVLVLCEGSNPCFSRLLFERLERALRSRGLEAKQRVRCVPTMDRNRFLQLNQCSDVMLDCLRWSGGNTSLDALAAGLPVVTTPGSLMRGRQSAAMLRALDCEELVCEDAQAAARRAVDVATDRERQRSLRQRIETHAGALFDRPEAPARLVQIIEELL